MPNWALGIDLGSRSTHAAAWTEGRLQLLTVDGVSAVPSIVMLQDETLVAGPAAEQLRLIKPAQIAQDPRRFVGGAPMVLGGLPVSPDAALAALLRLFASSGRAAFGDSAPSAVVLTHPAQWTSDQQEVLRDAGRAVFPGIEPQLVPEPVAAAVQCAQLYGLAEGRQLAVYGLGPGGFGSAVIGRRSGALRVLGTPAGTGDPSGEVLDEAASSVDRTVDLTLATIESARLRAEDIDALFLTGSATANPLVDRKVRARFGQRVVTAADGAAVTALGAAQIAGERMFGSPIATPLEAPPYPPAPSYPQQPVPSGGYGQPTSPGPAGSSRPLGAPAGRSAFAPIAMAAFVVLALAGTVILWLV